MSLKQDVAPVPDDRRVIIALHPNHTHRLLRLNIEPSAPKQCRRESAYEGSGSTKNVLPPDRIDVDPRSIGPRLRRMVISQILVRLDCHPEKDLGLRRQSCVRCDQILQLRLQNDIICSAPLNSFIANRRVEPTTAYPPLPSPALAPFTNSHFTRTSSMNSSTSSVDVIGIRSSFVLRGAGVSATAR